MKDTGIDKEISEKYLRECLLRGTGFENGKVRMYELYTSDVSSKDRIPIIKKEWGIGGCGIPHTGEYHFSNGFCGDNHDGKGINVEFMHEDTWYETLFSWKEVDKAMDDLVKSGQYLTLDELLKDYPRKVRFLQREELALKEGVSPLVSPIETYRKQIEAIEDVIVKLGGTVPVFEEEKKEVSSLPKDILIKNGTEKTPLIESAMQYAVQMKEDGIAKDLKVMISSFIGWDGEIAQIKVRDGSQNANILMKGEGKAFYTKVEQWDYEDCRFFSPNYIKPALKEVLSYVNAQKEKTKALEQENDNLDEEEEDMER